MARNSLGASRNLYAALFLVSLVASAATLGTVLLGFDRLSEAGHPTVTQMV